MIFKIKLLGAKNIYAQILILSVVMYALIIFASEYVYDDVATSKSPWVFLLAFFLSAYLYVLIALVRKLGLDRRIIRWLNWVPILVYIFGTATIYVDMSFMGAAKPYFFSLAHVFSLSFMSVCIYTILRHIFGSAETKTDHIWGATIAYLLLVVIFAEIYEFITIFNPTYLGKVYVMGTPNYIQCLMFSINTMSGLDSIYPEAHPILKKLASLESVIGNLFLVIILGRLLSHPLKRGG